MRKQEHKIWSMAVGSLLALLLVGCAANVGKSVKVSEQQRARYDSLSVTDAISALEKRVAEARRANMPFFAPNYFIEASEVLSEAQKTSAKKPKKALMSEIAKGDAILDKGEAMMVVIQNRFAKEIELKVLLDKFNAAGIYPKEYEKVISELSSLIEKVELEKADKIDRNKEELIKAMQALDIKTVQYTALHASDLINVDTRNKNGEKQAPATLAVALEVYKQAENRIAQAPHDEASVQRAGEEALFAARHARHISEQVVSLQNQFKVSVEAIVLQQEKHLLEISNAFGHRDLRDQPIEKQVAALVIAVGQQGKDAQTKVATRATAANDLVQELEKKIKDANSALQQANGLLMAQEAQINVLRTTVADLERQAKAPVKPQTAGVEMLNAVEEKVLEAMLPSAQTN